MSFAKLYGEGDNQLLVMLDETDTGEAGVRFTCDSDSVRVSFCLGFKAVEKADAFFATVTESVARNIMNSTLRELGISA